MSVSEQGHDGRATPADVEVREALRDILDHPCIGVVCGTDGCGQPELDAARTLLSRTPEPRRDAVGEEIARLREAERRLLDFVNTPCLMALLGDDPEDCGCMGCSAREYAALARTSAPDAGESREEVVDE